MMQNFRLSMRQRFAWIAGSVAIATAIAALPAVWDGAATRRATTAGLILAALVLIPLELIRRTIGVHRIAGLITATHVQKSQASQRRINPRSVRGGKSAKQPLVGTYGLAMEALTFEEASNLASDHKKRYGNEVAAAPVSPGGTFVDLILTSAGDQKVAVLKALRKSRSVPPHVLQSVSRNAPQTIVNAMKLEEGESLKRELESIGAKVLLRETFRPADRASS